MRVLRRLLSFFKRGVRCPKCGYDSVEKFSVFDSYATIIPNNMREEELKTKYKEKFEQVKREFNGKTIYACRNCDILFVITKFGIYYANLREPLYYVEKYRRIKMFVLEDLHSAFLEIATIGNYSERDKVGYWMY